MQSLEPSSKVIIGLERLILETIGFDFRARYPQKLLTKVVRRIFGTGDDAREFFSTAYAVCTDMYKTFVPLKRTTFAMVMGVVHLTALIRGNQDDVERVRTFSDAQGPRYAHDAVMETMLDLLDLYVQHHKATKMGTSSTFDLAAFMDIKIKLNADLDESAGPRHLYHCHRCEIEEPHPLSSRIASDPVNASTGPWPADASVRRTARGQDGTMRFVFEPEAAKEEQDTVDSYFKEEFEEYTVEVEEPVSPPPARENSHYRGARGPYRGGYRDRGGDHRRGGGPYGGYRGDRPRGGARGRYHH